MKRSRAALARSLRESSAVARCAAVALTLFFGRSAHAGTFSEEGAYLFDPTAVAVLDFEGAQEEGAPEHVTDRGALHGNQILKLGEYQGADFDIELPKARKSYRVSAWARGHEAIVTLELSYSDRTDDVAVLYPTGRMTSDGWVEVANEKIRVDGPRLVRANVGVFAAGGAEIDAVEIVPDGGDEGFPAVPNAACNGISDTVCAADQMCVFSECRNLSGWVPEIPDDRDRVADYLISRMTLLFGPFRERTHDLPNALVAAQQMKTAKDPWTYWNGFALAVRKLHDGHTTTTGVADFALRNRRPISVCFMEGDGDLTQDVAPKDPDYLDILVSHTGGGDTLGLARGDRLVSIDGQHPIAWARSLVESHWSLTPVSNPDTFAELASSLHRLIGRYASEIEVVRCYSAIGTCASPQVISMSELPFSPPDESSSIVSCDNRPLRHLVDSPLYHGNNSPTGVYSDIVIESDDVEKIYGLEWESLYTTNGTDGIGAGLKEAVNSWKNLGARGVILDHRTGNGGTILGPKILWNYAVPKRANDYYLDRQRAEDEQPSGEEGKAIFDAAEAKGSVNYAGSAATVEDVPVALLVTQDVSASDWLALGMKGAPKVRIFGPFETNGAFSTRYAFGYWLGMSYVIATGDTFLPDGATANGKGVVPDVIVLPKQSDLVAGKDTVYEAALAWVRSELAP